MKIKNFQKNSENGFSEINLSENEINWLAGIVIGDGRVSERYVRVYSNTIQIIWDCKEIFRRNFQIPESKFKIRMLGKERNGYKRNIETTELCINSTKFASNFKKLIQKQLDSPTSDFVRGLFDAEGSVDLAGNIVLWQRKDRTGNSVAISIKKFMDKNEIKYKIIKNNNFHIFEISGRYKNYQNIIKFSELVGFSVEYKTKDLNLILEVFSKKTSVSEQEILNFISKNQNVTLRSIIENFKIPKVNVYKLLNKFVGENRITKIKSYPNIYKLC